MSLADPHQELSYAVLCTRFPSIHFSWISEWQSYKLRAVFSIGEISGSHPRDLHENVLSSSKVERALNQLLF